MSIAKDPGFWLNVIEAVVTLVKRFIDGDDDALHRPLRDVLPERIRLDIELERQRRLAEQDFGVAGGGEER